MSKTTTTTTTEEGDFPLLFGCPLENVYQHFRSVYIENSDHYLFLSATKTAFRNLHNRSAALMYLELMPLLDAYDDFDVTTKCKREFKKLKSMFIKTNNYFDETVCLVAPETLHHLAVTYYNMLFRFGILQNVIIFMKWIMIELRPLQEVVDMLDIVHDRPSDTYHCFCFDVIALHQYTRGMLKQLDITDDQTQRPHGRTVRSTALLFERWVGLHPSRSSGLKQIHRHFDSLMSDVSTMFRRIETMMDAGCVTSLTRDHIEKTCITICGFCKIVRDSSIHLSKDGGNDTVERVCDALAHAYVKITSFIAYMGAHLLYVLLVGYMMYSHTDKTDDILRVILLIKGVGGKWSDPSFLSFYRKFANFKADLYNREEPMRLFDCRAIDECLYAAALTA